MIVIQGMVGAGKSTLSKLLARQYGLILFPEPVDENPYLSKFYESPSEYSFQMQVFLLHSRFKDTLQASHENENGCVLDTSIYTNDLFSLLHFKSEYMSRDDYYLNYCRLSDTFKSLVKPPTLMVYLKCSTEVAVQRIMKRNRAGELRAPIKYWYNLNKMYDKWYSEYTDSNKLLLDVGHLDLVNNINHIEFALKEIMESYNP